MQTVSSRNSILEARFLQEVCSLALLRIILLIAAHEPILVRALGRTIKLALHEFIGKSVLTEAEKVGLLWKLCTPRIAGSEKAKSCYLFLFMGGFDLCVSPFSRSFSAFPFSSLTQYSES